MKSIVLSAICISAVLLVLAIQSKINGMAYCSHELEEALSVSVSQTLKEVLEQESYGIHERNEFIAAFLQALVVRTNSDADMKVSVISADMEKGLLDIEVRERLSGEKESVLPEKDREIVVRRTVVFEKTLPVY